MEFDFFSKVVMRNPLFCANEITFDEFKKSDIARAAIYIASKSLYSESLTKNSESINIALYKYYLRSKYRATPFGLFGSVSVCDYGDKTEVLINDNKNSKCHLKFDGDFLKQTSSYFKQKKSNILFLNPTTYMFHGMFRYINGFENSTICEFSANDLITEFLLSSKKGISFSSAIQFFLSKEIDKELANAFILDLINRNLLLSSHFNFINHDSVAWITKNYQEISETKFPTVLNLNEISKIIEYENLLSDRKVVKSKNRSVFHIDLYRNLTKAKFNNSIKNKIREIIPLYFNTNLFGIGNSKLSSFINEFTKKYDKQEVGLLQALDPIIGIGYPIKSFKTCNNYLLEGISEVKNQNDNSTVISEFEKILLRKTSCLKESENHKITIDPNDLPEEKLDTKYIPSTFSLICELLEDEKILIKTFGGTTANSLLSRFSMFPPIEDLSKEISIYEKQHQCTDRVLVDICFTPSGKEGNVVSRGLLYDYFIYFSPWEGMDFKKAISLEEITIRVQYGRIILFCKRINKELVPILPSAHNYRKTKTFHIYEFLSDIQGPSFNSSYGTSIKNVLSVLHHIPRVNYKSCILSKEKWIIETSDFDFLPVTKEQFTAKGYPDCFLIVQGDNVLQINLNVPIELEIFNKILRKKGSMIIEESIEHYDGIKHNDSTLRNELIISMKKL